MRQALLSIVILAAAVAASGCERIAPVRTLPNWVQGVYVPIVKNTSYWPGIEEDATRKIQESFLADGRVGVVPKQSADIILQVEIGEWRVRTSGTSGDDIADRTEYTLTAKVQLFEPLAEQPLATLPPIVVRRDYNTDSRSIDYDPEPDRVDDMLRNLGESIVRATITGFPATMQ
ncbi:MAG: LPS assembly lipoprotein LptE [Candidatus Sumerlaeia bacterium]